MKKRYLYMVLFGLPGLLVAWVTAMGVFGGAAGIAWLFVYGDDSWPALAHTGLLALFAGVFMIVWAGALVAGFVIGRRLEKSGGMDRRHILLSAGVGLAMILVIVGHQISVGNIGPPSDSRACSLYCRDRGFAGSGMPPADSGRRECYCYDGRGRKAQTLSLDSIETAR